MKPNGGGTPPGTIEKAIVDAFGSYDKFKEDFVQAGVDPVRLRLGMARGQGRQARRS